MLPGELIGHILVKLMIDMGLLQIGLALWIKERELFVAYCLGMLGAVNIGTGIVIIIANMLN